MHVSTWTLGSNLLIRTAVASTSLAAFSHYTASFEIRKTKQGANLRGSTPKSTHLSTTNRAKSLFHYSDVIWAGRVQKIGNPVRHVLPVVPCRPSCDYISFYNSQNFVLLCTTQGIPVVENVLFFVINRRSKGVGVRLVSSVWQRRRKGEVRHHELQWQRQ